MEIRPMYKDDLLKVKEFTDQWIGTNYYSLKELEDIFELSEGTSFVAIDSTELMAVRLTFAPGKWIEKGRGLSPELWRVNRDKVAYFKSLFVCEKAQAKGLGKELSRLSMEALVQKGALAVICHSWMESPNNSSWRYLKKMRFEEVNRWPMYWHPIDYDCTRCGKNNKCVCTAMEMIRYLES